MIDSVISVLALLLGPATLSAQDGQLLNRALSPPLFATTVEEAALDPFAQEPRHSILRPCDGPNVDPWIEELRDRVLALNDLARYAIERDGQPLTCEGSVTARFEGAKFGILRLGFPEGVTFQIESFPPESSVVTLSAAAGFHDEGAVRRLLESYTARIGLDIDWSSGTVSTEGDRRVETYWDPEEGLNASARLTFVGGALVAIRVSLAL